MDTPLTCQGREIDAAQIAWLRSVVSDHPQWSRHRIPQHICSQWNWRTHAGQLKTIAARSLIDTLEQYGLIALPPIGINQRRSPRPTFPKGFMPPECTAIACGLSCLTPLTISIPSLGSHEETCVGYYLTRYH